jgi:outer membrane protein assembly factor BamB
LEIDAMKRALLLLLACSWTSAEAPAADWYRWRGFEQNGVAIEKDLPDRFSVNPKAPDNNLIWKAPYGGRSTPIIMNGRLYYINSVGQGETGQERVLCLNADTGEKVWEHRFNVWHTDIDILRVGWTQLAGDPETGNIYAAGTQGLLLCFNSDGKILWQHSLTEEYGRISGYGGRNSSPVVDGDLVIYGMLNASWGDQAGPGNRFVAFDKNTGAVRWWSAPTARPKDTYASVPVIAEINGQRLLVTGAGDGGVYALKVQTGEKVWGYPISQGGLSSSPVVRGNLVYICHGAENLDTAVQGKVVCLDASKVQGGKPALVWQKPGIKVRYTSPLLHEDRLYVPDENGRLHCLDAATGKALWKPFRYGQGAKGSPVWADGKIYIPEETSRFHILQPGEKGCKDLYVQYFLNPEGEGDLELAGSPAVANSKVYFATSREMYCIGKRTARSGSFHLETRRKDQSDADAKPAHIQVVPADVVLHPGGSAQFRALAFDEHGRFLREVKVEWSLPTPTPPPPPPGGKPAPAPPPLKGEIHDGKLTVDKALPGQFGYVGAQVGELTSRARIRVLPRLPVMQDFKNVPEGRFPGGWVNCQLKYAVQTKDGAKVLTKLANNASPLFARAQAYIGLPNWTDYTIEADLMGAKKGENLSDMGLTGNRYTLILDGNKQRLHLVSWESTPRARIDKEIEYPWKENVWYHMKLTVDVQGEKATVRGKVWERGQEEPSNWTIEVEDPVGNKEGAPALYAYSQGITEKEIGAQSSYANVRVTPNRAAR